MNKKRKCTRLFHLLMVNWLWSIAISFVYGRSSLVTPPATVIETPVFQFELRTRTPAILNGTQMYFHPGFQSAALPQPTRTDGLLQVNIMLPHKDDDITGCSGPWRTMNEFNQTFEQSFILLMVGACSSINTLEVSSNSGALGVIVYGCPPEKPYNCETRLQNAYSLVPGTSPLPAILSIASANGQLLVQFLKSNLNSTSPPPQDALQMLIKSSGPLVPIERTALLAIVNETTMGEFEAGPDIALPPWTLARFQDPAIDLCLNRTIGLWCEFGHVVMIDIYYFGWMNINALPDEFGALNHLKYFSNFGNVFSGPIPAAWCNLTQLQTFRIKDQFGGGITSVPDCLGTSWTHLRHLQLDGNSLTTLPDSLSQLSSLAIFRMSNNRIQAVPSLVNLTQLVVIDFGSNAITEIPSFGSFVTNLLQIGFSSNQINVPISPAAFDGMSALQILDLNTNHITGPLPNLIGCTNLQIIDFSSQRNLTTNVGGFNVSMPVSWTALINTKEIYLQENALVSPVYSSAMLSLQRIDLSHNYLTNAIPSNLANTNPLRFLDSVLGSSMVSMKLSYNLLAGRFVGTSGVLFSPSLSELYLDHNQFTNLVGPFIQATSPFTAIDFSFNNISLDAAGFPPGSPTLRMVYLNFRGNPYFHMTQLPSWVVVGSTLTEELGQPYGCAEFSATTAPLLDFRVDPGFWSYQHCQCNQGTFGRPPLCHSVPNAAILQPDHVITSSEIGDDFSEIVASVRGVGSELTVPSTGNYSRAFSDSMYGENRLTLGMSTVWVIDVTSQYADDPDAYVMAGLPTPVPIESYRINTTSTTPSPLWTPVRMITARLHVSATQFTAFEDVISVYEGSSDLKGNRVYTMRGTDTKSLVRSTVYTTSPEYLLEHNASISQISDPRLYEIQVFSPMASVQFTSRAINGLHFYATYSYDFTCPDGYFYNRDVTPNQCHLNYEEYHVGLPIRSAVFVVGSLTIIFILINIVFLGLFWSSPVYLAASEIFVAVKLVLLLFMGLGSFLYAAIPHDHDSVGSAICIGRAWLTCLPLTGILGVLLAKTNRLDTIFGATTLQVKKMTDLDIGKTVLLVCSVQIVLLGIYSGLPLSRPQLAVGKGNLDDKLVLSCSQESGFMVWVGIEIAYIACLMLPAAYLGYKTRNLPSQYNESAHIQNAIILLIFFGIIIVPLDIFIQDSPEAAVLIQGLGQAFMCMMLTAIIFCPKLYYLCETIHLGVGARPRPAPAPINSLVEGTVSTAMISTTDAPPQPRILPKSPHLWNKPLPAALQQHHQPAEDDGPREPHPSVVTNVTNDSTMIASYIMPRVYRSECVSVVNNGTTSGKPLPLVANPIQNQTTTAAVHQANLNQVTSATSGGIHGHGQQKHLPLLSPILSSTTIIGGAGTANSHPSSHPTPQIELLPEVGGNDLSDTTPRTTLTHTNKDATTIDIPASSSEDASGLTAVDDGSIHLIVSNPNDHKPPASSSVNTMEQFSSHSTLTQSATSPRIMMDTPSHLEPHQFAASTTASSLSSLSSLSSSSHHTNTR